MKKKLNEMTENELALSWQKRIEKYLLGKSIIKIEYMSEKDSEEQGFDCRPIQLLLNNGIWLTITSDDEGNDGGAIHTNIKEFPIMPVIY